MTDVHGRLDAALEAGAGGLGNPLQLLEGVFGLGLDRRAVPEVRVDPCLAGKPTRLSEVHVALVVAAPVDGDLAREEDPIAAADRGFSSAKNEDAALVRGVRRVILPRPGRKTPARRAHERQRWFRRGQRWRVGCEGRISVLKRRHGLRRCRYHGADGAARWVGLGVIADNLVSTVNFLNARAAA